MIAAFILAGIVLGLLRLRHSRRNTLAGLKSDRPTFTLTPPRRWSTTTRDHRL